MTEVKELRSLNDVIGYLVSKYEDLKGSDREEDRYMADGIMIALPKLYNLKHLIEDRIKELEKKIEKLEKQVEQGSGKPERVVAETLASAFGVGLYTREIYALKWVLEGKEAEE